MGELLVMRHGKSDWGSGVDDHERPVAPRGVKAAKAMGRFLKASGAVPDLAMTSSAVRARTTAELVLAHGGLDCPLRVEGALYGAGPEGVLEVIRGVESSVGRLLVVGHEPWCSELVCLLSGATVAFSTATVACLDAGEIPWSRLVAGSAHLRWLLPPKLLTHG